MSMNAQLIESIRSLVSDVASNEDEMLALRSENQSLKERLLSAESENVALHTEIEGKNKSLHALSIELNHLNKQRLEYIDNVRQHFMVQADLMELKYEVSYRVAIAYFNYFTYCSLQYV